MTCVSHVEFSEVATIDGAKLVELPCVCAVRGTMVARDSYRRDIIDSPLRGIPTMVDCVVKVCMIRN